MRTSAIALQDEAIERGRNGVCVLAQEGFAGLRVALYCDEGGGLVSRSLLSLSLSACPKSKKATGVCLHGLWEPFFSLHVNSQFSFTLR